MCITHLTNDRKCIQSFAIIVFAIPGVDPTGNDHILILILIYLVIFNSLVTHAHDPAKRGGGLHFFVSWFWSIHQY